MIDGPGALKPPRRVFEFRSPVQNDEVAIKGSEQLTELFCPNGFVLSLPGIDDGSCWAWAIAATNVAVRIRKSLLHILQPSFEAVCSVGKPRSSRISPGQRIDGALWLRH